MDWQRKHKCSVAEREGGRSQALGGGHGREWHVARGSQASKTAESVVESRWRMFRDGRLGSSAVLGMPRLQEQGR